MSLHRLDGEPLVDRVDLKRLRYFVAVAEAGSFSRAAERAGIAQSHLSRQIMSLEGALGHRLFVRRARHVELTDAGQILLAETGHLMQRLNTLPERMNAANTGAIGSLCIGIAAAGSFHSIVARTIESFARQRPQLALKFSVAPRSQLVESVVDRKVQACFAQAPARDSPDIRVERLITEPVLIALHRSHRLAGRDHVDLADIAGDPFVMVERNCAPEFYDDVMVACQKAGFAPQLVCHTSQELGALPLVSAGMAVTLVPAFVARMNFENVHFVSIADATLNTSLDFITRTDEHMVGVSLLRKQALAVAGRSSAERARSAGGRTDKG
jgi:DNA-binding transcriptional LysR family regulator